MEFFFFFLVINFVLFFWIFVNIHRGRGENVFLKKLTMMYIQKSLTFRYTVQALNLFYLLSFFNVLKILTILNKKIIIIMKLKLVLEKEKT